MSVASTARTMPVLFAAKQRLDSKVGQTGRACDHASSRTAPLLVSELLQLRVTGSSPVSPTYRTAGQATFPQVRPISVPAMCPISNPLPGHPAARSLRQDGPDIPGSAGTPSPIRPPPGTIQGASQAAFSACATATPLWLASMTAPGRCSPSRPGAGLVLIGSARWSATGMTGQRKWRAATRSPHSAR